MIPKKSELQCPLRRVLSTWLAKRFETCGTDTASRHKLAVELAVELSERLITEGVEHIHLYTLNQTDLCLDISLALGAPLRRAA